MSYALDHPDVLDASVSSERSLGEDILLSHDVFFLDMVLFVDPMKES
jgi:hypothetical protein